MAAGSSRCDGAARMKRALIAAVALAALVPGAAQAQQAQPTPDGQGLLSVRIQKNAAPYDGFLDKQVKVGPNWRLYQFRTQSGMDIAEGTAQLTLHTGAARQEIEIGPVYVIREEPVLVPAN